MDRHYRITLTGITPLLMHNDDIEWSDKMKHWQLIPENKAGSQPGDDRYPPYRWVGALYHDNTHVALPVDNIMTSLRQAGAALPTGQSKKTFKAQTQSGIVPEGLFFEFACQGQQIPILPFFEQMEQRRFDEYQELASKYGFLLFLKRARVGRAKHIRVRPRFDVWGATGVMRVIDDQITDQVFTRLWTFDGERVGLGSWRAGGQTPGPWGRFTAIINRL